MKHKILYNFLVLVLFLFVFSACNKEDTIPEENPIDNYLVGFEEVDPYYSSSAIQSLFMIASNGYPEIEPLIEKVEHGVTVYKISYNTLFMEEPVIASGLVCVPDAEGEFPVLSYQNGTNTLHEDAPSVDPDDLLFQMLESVASMGFVVTIPDYLGFGTSDNMFHPYLHKESTVQSLLDMQRATKEFVKNHLDISINKDLYLAGYSQGGWATLQVQKAIEQQHSNEFILKASACGAGPYNLKYINEYIFSLTEYPMPYYIGYIYNTYINLGLTTPVNEIFKAPFAARIPTLYDGTKSGPEINAQLTTQVADLFTADFLNNYNTDPKYAQLISLLEENSISAWKAKTPTRLYHGTNDTFVPPMGTSRILQEFQNQGVGVNDVIMIPLEDKTHQTGIVPASIGAISWFLELKDSE